MAGDLRWAFGAKKQAGFGAKKMTDNKVLRLLGWAYGGLTAIVVLVAFTVVIANLNGPASASDDTSNRLGQSE